MKFKVGDKARVREDLEVSPYKKDQVQQIKKENEKKRKRG